MIVPVPADWPLSAPKYDYGRTSAAIDESVHSCALMCAHVHSCALTFAQKWKSAASCGDAKAVEDMFEEKNTMSESLAFTNSNGTRVYYVFPRLKPFLASKKMKAETFADKAGISRNTLSKIFSGLYVSDEMIEACAKAAESLFKGEFDFAKEKMAAQGNYEKKDVLAFIGNRPYEEAAEELGIDKYMLEWLMQEKKVSEDFNNTYVSKRLTNK